MAACLAVIVGVSLSMPGIVERIEPGTFSGFETAATMLGGSVAPGIYRDWTARFCSWRMRDDFMLPHPSAEQGGTAG